MQNTVRPTDASVADTIGAALRAAGAWFAERRQPRYAEIKFTDAVERELAEREYRLRGMNW